MKSLPEPQVSHPVRQLNFGTVGVATSNLEVRARQTVKRGRFSCAISLMIEPCLYHRWQP